MMIKMLVNARPDNQARGPFRTVQEAVRTAFRRSISFSAQYVAQWFQLCMPVATASLTVSSVGDAEFAYSARNCNLANFDTSRKCALRTLGGTRQGVSQWPRDLRSPSSPPILFYPEYFERSSRELLAAPVASGAADLRLFSGLYLYVSCCASKSLLPTPIWRVDPNQL